MKKVFCLIIALSLVFGAVSPVFAATEVFNQAWSDYFDSIDDNITSLLRVFTGSVGTMYNSVSELMSWLTPVGSFNSNSSITGVTLYEIVDYIAWTLSGVGPTVYQTFQDIATSVTSTENILTNTSSYVGYLVTSLTNSYKDASSLTASQIKDNSHRALVDTNTASYTWKFLQSDGSLVTNNYSWTAGTPLGNLALMLQKFNENFSTFGSYYIATFVPNLLTHYADTLTTWEHSSNTQTSFVPESLTQGLYRYLAYIQSDTSYLGYNLIPSLTNYFPSVSQFTGQNALINAHRDLTNSNALYPLYTIRFNNGILDDTVTKSWIRGTPLGNIALILDNFNNNTLGSFQALLKNYNNARSYTNWNTLNTVATVSHTSVTDGLFKILQTIQTPIARLAFVHANDEEIAARNAAKDDQNSVINNFVAPTGGATASPSDYAGVSQASSNFKSNFNTGVSSSGIWDTFSNTHYTWFTQDTANVLDTVSASTRGNYDTPLLDNYYHEILGYFDNNRRSEDNAYDYVGNFIEEFNLSREVIEEEVVDR